MKKVNYIILLVGFLILFKFGKSQNIDSNANYHIGDIRGQIVKKGSKKEYVFMLKLDLISANTIINTQYSSFGGGFRFEFKTNEIDTNNLYVVIKETEEGDYKEFKFPISLFSPTLIIVNEKLKFIIEPATYKTKDEYKEYIKSLPKMLR